MQFRDGVLQLPELIAPSVSFHNCLKASAGISPYEFAWPMRKIHNLSATGVSRLLAGAPLALTGGVVALALHRGIHGWEPLHTLAYT